MPLVEAIAIIAIAAAGTRFLRQAESTAGLRRFDDPVALASDPAVDVVVELIGGSEDPARLGPWDAPSPGMTKLEPGRWYHLAVVWDYDLPIATSKGTKRKMVSRAFLNGKPVARPLPDRDAAWLRDGLPAPRVGDTLEMISRNHNIVVDELRVSDVMRAGFRAKSFPVPQRPYEPDGHTRLIVHFDGNFHLVGEAGQILPASFADKK